MKSEKILEIVKDIWDEEIDIENKLLAIDDMTSSKSMISKLTKADLVEVVKWMLEFCVN